MIKNDNDSDDPFVANNSVDNALFTVGRTGDITATGAVSGTNVLARGSQGLQIRNGVSTLAKLVLL